MNKEHMIKWNKKDYSNLRNAINRFNRKIKKLEQLDSEMELPNLLNYKELKEDILTRKNLNKTISSLNRIKFKNAFDEIKLASGEIISRWEYNDIMKKQPIAIEKIQKDLAEEMKNQTFKGLKNEKVERLESTLKTLKNFKNKEGKALRYSLDRIKKIGGVDYEIKKAQTFKDNFLRALKEGASTFKNYKMFAKDLEKIKNPKDFYNYVKDSDTFMDLFIWYNDETGTITYGNFNNNEEAFNNALINDFDYNIEDLS